MKFKIDMTKGQFNIEFEGDEPMLFYQQPEVAIRHLGTFSAFLNQHKEELIHKWNENYENFMLTHIRSWISTTDDNQLLVNWFIDPTGNILARRN